MNQRTMLMLGCTVALLASVAGLPSVSASSDIVLPSGGNCEFNAGTCNGGHCYINAGTCSGDCYLNAGTCAGSCDYNTGICESGATCQVNVGSCSAQEKLLSLVRFTTANTDASKTPITVVIGQVGSGGNCEVNLGTCHGGSCYINDGYCSGSCYLNLNSCYGDCTINDGYCGDGADCYVNVGVCTSEQTLLALLRSGVVLSDSSASFRGPIPPLPVVRTPGSGNCNINVGTCDGGSCYLNAGTCEGSCTWNLGACEEGGSCYVNAGSCSTQERLLALLTNSAQTGASIPPIFVIHLPSGNCTVNAGTCEGGHCYVNTGTCDEGYCTINAGYCDDDADCYVNVGSCYAPTDLLGLLRSGTTADAAAALPLALPTLV